MAVPKKKTSTTRRNNRRSHDGLTFTQLSKCPNCGEHRMPHRACKSCGHYKGEVRIAVDAE